MPVIIAPEETGNADDDYTTVFLAGAIDMGTAVDWQTQVIEQIGTEFCIFNPRREKFTPDTLDEQIEWELDKLERADYIFLWFPKDSKAPISFFEAGLYWNSGKLIVGAEPGFYRRRNLELTAERYGVILHDSLDEMIFCLRLGWATHNDESETGDDR